MRKIWFILVSFFATLFVTGTAFAQKEVPANDDIGGLLKGLIEAVKGSEWSVVVSLGIMILVYLATKVKFVKDWLPKAAKPWVAAIAGVLGAVAMTALTTGNWLTAILNGLVTGAAASGFWELVGKKLLKSDNETSEG